MTGTVLDDHKRSAADACAPPQPYRPAGEPAEPLHVAHGLVAIANGPDYCLCGHTWPCGKRAEY